MLMKAGAVASISTGIIMLASIIIGIGSWVAIKTGKLWAF